MSKRIFERWFHGPTRWTAVWQWDEFNLQSINAVCGELLDQPNTLAHSQTPVPMAEDELTKPEVTSYRGASKLHRWLRTLLHRTVPGSLAALGIQIDGTLKFDAIHPREDFRPHFFCGNLQIIQPGYKEKWATFAVGSSQGGSRWNMKKIRNKIGNTDDFDMALHAMAADCKEFQTRYGFILTFNELIACHFTAPITCKTDWCRVRVARVPYTNTGPDKLTPELAAWALCMLGASERTTDAPRISALKLLKPADKASPTVEEQEAAEQEG